MSPRFDHSRFGNSRFGFMRAGRFAAGLGSADAGKSGPSFGMAWGRSDGREGGESGETSNTGGGPGEWEARPHAPGAGGEDGPRLNLLISYTGWREESAVNQLPRLLAPMGIQSIRVHSGEEATQVISLLRVHIALVDLAMPLHPDRSDSPAGSRILTLLRRLEQPPPTVVLRPAAAAARESARTLNDALREGAFAVLDRPVELETVLEIMRRVLRRHYADHWPGG